MMALPWDSISYIYIYNNYIINTAKLTVDLQIQGHTLFLRDLSYLRLGSCYRRDLGVYFHIFEVQDHNNDIINTAVLTVDLQIQGHTLFCVTFHISGWVCAIGEISVSISIFHIFEVQDHNNDIKKTAVSTVLPIVDLQNPGHALFCVTFHISGWVRAIREILVSISTYLRSRIIILI